MQRVAIIGAGPAGLAAAVALRDRRVPRITVFERRPSVGGQCRSFEIDERAYDLGASLTTTRCSWVREVAEKLGMTRRMVEGRRIVDVSGAAPSLPANLFDRLLVRGWASVYERMRRLARIERVGYADAGAGTGQTLAVWLRSHGLGRVQELFDVLCAVHGFPSMLELPAIYALKLLDPIYLQAGVQRVLQAGEPDVMDFVEGYQDLWERIDERYDLQTRCNTTIDAVDRGPWGVRVHGRGPGGPFDETFDKLVVACSLRSAREFLDVSPEERRLFGQLRHRESWVTLVRMEGAPRIATTVYPYARDASPGQPTAFTSRAE
ncbi:MAG: NAD(P)-binding protein [Myxococcota bacterium]